MFTRINGKRDPVSKKKCPSRRLFLEPLEDRHLRAGMAELLSDLNSGAGDSFPMAFTEFQDEVIFAANGTEVWKTDGTSAGTVLIKDIGGSLGTYAYIGEIVPVSGQLAIGVKDSNGTLPPTDDQVQLWKTDGTTAGTVLVKDFGVGSSVGGLSDATFLVELSGKVYGAVTTPTTGSELWRSDLTSTGTVMVKDIAPGSGSYGAFSSYPENLTALDGKLFFSANNILNGRELWTSDGTSTGTVMLEDLVAGTYGSYPTQLTPFAGAYYFGALDVGADSLPGTADDAAQLWKTDGTVGGATLLDSFGVGSTSRYPQLTAVGGTLFGVVDTPATGWELWKTDGTTGGAQLVKDIYPGSNSYGAYSSFPYNLTNVNDTLFFTAADGTNGTELWKSDGTSTGTVLVKDINPSGGFFYSSNPRYLTNVNGTLYFVANDGTSGDELWKSDGTSTGTVLVQDINPGSASYGAHSSFPYSLRLANGALFFAADDGTHGREPWILDVSDPDKIGVHRGRQFYLDVNGNGTWNNVAGGDAVFSFGNPGDEPIVGDWDGDGFDNIGVHRGSLFYLDFNGNGTWDGTGGGDVLSSFGIPGDEPIAGDWNGSGADKIGVHRGNKFYLDTNGNGAWNGVAGGDNVFSFGNTGDEPIAGDWNGNGTDSIGVHRANKFYLDTNGNGAWNGVAGGDNLFSFGNTTGDEAVTGDWSGDGTDSIGVHRGNSFYLDTNGNGAWNGVAGGDNLYVFGNPTGDIGIAGNWEPVPPLLAAGGAVVASDLATELSTEEVAPILQQAIGLWGATGLSPLQLQSLAQLTVRVADLSGARLGQAAGTTITLDSNAAGYGWFIDPTPSDDAEFSSGAQLSTLNPQLQMDLLTVVLHELGHVLGYGHGDDFEALLETLAVGTRRLLTASQTSP